MSVFGNCVGPGSVQAMGNFIHLGTQNLDPIWVQRSLSEIFLALKEFCYWDKRRMTGNDVIIIMKCPEITFAPKSVFNSRMVSCRFYLTFIKWSITFSYNLKWFNKLQINSHPTSWPYSGQRGLKSTFGVQNILGSRKSPQGLPLKFNSASFGDMHENRK